MSFVKSKNLRTTLKVGNWQYYGGPKGRAMRQYLSDSIHATVDDDYVTVDNNYVMVDNNYVMVDNNYATMSMRQFTMMTRRKLHDDWPDHCM